MKKFTTLALTAALALSMSMAHAVDLDIKAGIAYPTGPEKVGFDSELSLNVPLQEVSGNNPGFYLNLNPGFTWLSYEQKIGETEELEGSGIESEITQDTNIFHLPMMANLELRFPVRLGMKRSAIYVAAGAGYSWLISKYDRPAYDEIEAKSDTAYYDGFAAQGKVGLAYNMNTNLDLLTEVGYRYSEVKDDNGFKIDMSGVNVHLGVRLAFGGSSW